ncbi:MAG: bifunctional phosphopantothenoylcysteine decarboxylase/phosphopantothenate--cysteine ligase CoaBC, partial [Halieaceae bacterium]|nr:bifunctional phosphopantothenoylcysteine decarboxylase/phosphopantothenate--cysteine ligase CoaBC [Halieaceae bacterium]
IELARWADLVVVAPATADFLSRLAQGRADDLLTTLCLATPAPRLLAPAMNQQMWRDAATNANIDTLRARGIHFAGPAEGSQACGDIGPGRMQEPAAIVAAAQSLFESGLLDGLRVVVTAGPTREPLDPVRYLSNHSSGKMGFAIARAAAEAGARTTLIAGPVTLETPEQVHRVDVVTALEMQAAVSDAVRDCDVFISCAAVADYRPDRLEQQKIKKQGDEVTLTLVKNPDIVAGVARLENGPFTVGFAAETENLLDYARGKLETKGLDMIVANDVSSPALGFNSDRNAATVLWRGDQQALPEASKHQLAAQLIQLLAQRLGARADNAA